MNTNDKYNWTDFYTAFATKLLEYKNDRWLLLDKLRNVFSALNQKFPKLESDGEPIDIDPFTIFAFFSRGITDKNRKALINALISEFRLSLQVPESFDGVPLLNNLNTNFFYFKESRGHKDIDQLWDLFEAALKLADEGSKENKNRFIETYENVRAHKGINWNITIGLYWIRPYTYLNLDSRNRWFIGDLKSVSDDAASQVLSFKKLPPAEDYLRITDQCLKAFSFEDSRFKSFPELSDQAFLVSEEINEQKRKEKKQKSEITKPVTTKDNALGDGDVSTVHYWTFSPGERGNMWEYFYENGLMGIGWSDLGDLSTYASKEEIKNKLQELRGKGSSYSNATHAIWSFINELKTGDVVFAKRGRNEVLGRGVVESDYIYDDEASDSYPNLRKVKWTHKGNWNSNGGWATKVLTDVTNLTELTTHLKSLFEDDEEIEEIEILYPTYSKEDFLDEVYIDAKAYDALVDILKAKKNVILQGAPGVGKTFTAKRLAYSLMGEKDVERVSMVQFHQNYSYEDFVMGIRPNGSEFKLSIGPFYEFCKEAEEDSEKDYYFIIDEINRGNLSKILGELFMLIESDKRGNKNALRLLYSNEKFFIPDNVYIIGMMNTADRSLAMLDFALRRRFAFFNLEPGFDSSGFRIYQEKLNSPKFNALIDVVKQLNEAIGIDETLGEGYCIGHSYFCNFDSLENCEGRLSGIVEYELIPLLKEYWFDEPTKVRQWSENLRNAIK